MKKHICEAVKVELYLLSLYFSLSHLGYIFPTANNVTPKDENLCAVYAKLSPESHSWPDYSHAMC